MIDTRYLRLPFKYLDMPLLNDISKNTWTCLKSLYNIHNNQPATHWWIPGVKMFLYHPSFARWMYEKLRVELLVRGKHIPKLDEKFKTLKSRSLAEFVPPTDTEIAEDVVWLCEYWRFRKNQNEFGREKLPSSYLDLARKLYGYEIKGQIGSGIELVPGFSCYLDRGWYFTESEEAAQLNNDLVEAYLRGGSYETRFGQS